MTPESIYGPYRECLFSVLARLEEDLENENQRYWREKGDKLFEHLSTRIKTEESMREKCNRRGLPPTPSSALRNIRDSIGVRIVCAFVEDIYRTVRVIRGLEGLRVIEEKDYILHVKENGYRSYHMIVERESEEADCMGNCPGTYFAIKFNRRYRFSKSRCPRIKVLMVHFFKLIILKITLHGI